MAFGCQLASFGTSLGSVIMERTHKYKHVAGSIPAQATITNIIYIDMELIENKKEVQRATLAKRDGLIYQQYVQLRLTYVNASFYRICRTIAKEMIMSPERVRQILKNKYNINCKQYSL